MKEKFVYHDISPRISPGIAVWPGDRSFQRKVSLDFAKGNSILLSSIESTLHLGAHADAPNHYHPDGAGIDQRPLWPYLGQAQLVTVRTPKGCRIVPADLEGQEIQAKRVLFRTNSFPDSNHWNSDFCALSVQLVQFLIEKGVTLIGIDTPSVDLEADQKLEVHLQVFNYDLAILEGLVFGSIPDGLYTLVALPLKIKDADASPVRAILIEHEKD